MVLSIIYNLHLLRLGRISSWVDYITLKTNMVSAQNRAHEMTTTENHFPLVLMDSSWLLSSGIADIRSGCL